jgi:hypothetical protein
MHIFEQLTHAVSPDKNSNPHYPTSLKIPSTVALYQTLVHAYGHIYITKFLTDGAQRSDNVLMVSIVKI